MGDTSTEVDDDLSFNNANTFEKEKIPEEKMTTFMKDISLVAVNIVKFNFNSFKIQLLVYSMFVYFFCCIERFNAQKKR